jgi:hypothetical protein
MASDDQKWRYAHALFSRIRAKTLRADEANDQVLQQQYSFEEICAKTLFNMSGHIPGEEFPQGQRISILLLRKDFREEVGVIGTAQHLAADAVALGMTLKERDGEAT